MRRWYGSEAVVRRWWDGGEHGENSGGTLPICTFIIGYLDGIIEAHMGIRNNSLGPSIKISL